MVKSPPSDTRELLVRAIESLSEINGRYSQVKRLGANAGDGNFSLVFSARDGESGDEVCLKVYNILKQDDYREACFRRESGILDELRGQPDILPLVEAENKFTLPLKANGNDIPFPFSYLSTALARSDVRSHIYSAERKALRDLEIFRAICRGLQRVHSAAICHRDLKPANFFLGPGNQVWLGDFGTARRLDGAEPPLRQDYGLMWRGDLRYTAPELLCGLDDDKLFFRGDLFSLGAILFEVFSQTLLTSYIYDQSFLANLRGTFYLMAPDERTGMLHQLIPTIASARPLPSLRSVPNSVPPSIMPRIDRLYHGLANLDYRRRLCDFEQIFRELNICEQILRKEKQYTAWLRQREVWKERAEAKAARGKSRQ